MFTIAGILADEEPKTPISSSGFYNSSDLGSLPSEGSGLSSTILNGKSELTLMAWISVSDFSLYDNNGTRPFIEFSPTSYPISISATKVSSTIRNSNLGYTTVTHLDTYLENTFYHVCVTQSLSNNRIRIYVNGVLLESAVMSYSNYANSSDFVIRKQDGVSMSQFNAYDRELTEAEVAEHYVNQGGQVGVLSYDAMSSSQRSGLIYCASLTDDISFAGNEFKDRSTNNMTLSDTPSLTGQQIYVYTALSQNPASFSGLSFWIDGENGYTDLSGNSVALTNNGTTITANELNGLDVFTFSGSGQYMSLGTALGKPANFTVFALIRADNLSKQGVCGSADSGGASATAWGDFVITQTTKPTGSLSCTHSDDVDYRLNTNTDNLLSSGSWYVIVVKFANGVLDKDIWVNGVKTSVAHSGGTSLSLNSGTAYEYTIGRTGAYNGSYFNGDIAEHFVYDEARSDAEITQLTTYLQDKYGI